ncbi:MAG TPA: M28 family peptidase, partial [Niastella sp.]|nr:M28 family peptidase [Niastella sp.]
IAMIPGSTYPDQYYVISAHYDHLGVKNGQIYYGTDDNASGSACLLALAAYFKQHPPKHSFILASFDAEEKGLVGSRYFVAHPPVDSTKIILNVNMDMVSRNPKNEIYASGTYHYPFLKKYVDSIKTMTTVNVLLGHDNPAQGHDDWTNQSDHYPFHLAHIPFLYFGVEDHPDYHKPTDTFDKVDKGFYYRVCSMIKETIVLLDKQEKLQ